MMRILAAIKRFAGSSPKARKHKIFNRVKWILRIHRYVIWSVSKKLGIAELSTKKYETFFVPTRDNSISRLIFLEGKFDLDKLVKVSKLIDIRNSTLIDVGANLGSICIPACKRNIVLKSIAIEPDRETFEYLKRNVIANRLSSITTINSVVGASSGVAVFGSKTDNHGDSKVVSKSNEFEFQNTYPMNQITLNSLIYNVDPLDTIIWIDVQGYEPIILEGASEFLERRTPLVLEVFPLAINEYSTQSGLEKHLSNYTKYAKLRFDILNPHFEPIENFKKEYENLEQDKSYADFLFV